MRAFSLSTRLRALQANSPFSPVFYDVGKVEQKNIMMSWAAEQKLPSGLWGVERTKYITQQWKMVRPSERSLLQRQREEQHQVAVMAFVEKHITRETFNGEYGGDFTLVKREAKSLLAATMDIKGNQAFFIQVEKLVKEKRGLIDGYPFWSRVNRGKRRVDFDELSESEKQMAKNKAIAQYAASLEQARADFGDYEFPVFVETTEKTVENEQHYAYQWKLWLKLRRELNELRKEQKVKNKSKKIVTKLTTERRLSERQKFGFIPGSEKMDKTAYFIFMEKTRAQFKDKKLTAAKLGKLWKSTSATHRAQYERMALAESNKRKILNKATIQAVIRGRVYFPLTALEARDNLGENQLKLYKMECAAIKKQLEDNQ